MVRRCVVGGCSNTTKNGITLHRLPKDEKVGKCWTRFVKNTRVWKGPSEWSLICSSHFDRECFDELNSVALEVGYKPKLKATVVPTTKILPEKLTTSSSEDSENTLPGLTAVELTEAAILRNTAAQALLDLGGSFTACESWEGRDLMQLELNKDNFLNSEPKKICTGTLETNRSAVVKRYRSRVLQEIDLEQSELLHKNNEESRTRSKPNKWTRGVQVKPVMVSTATQCELLKPDDPEVEEEDSDVDSESESDSDDDYEPCDNEHNDPDTDDEFMRDRSGGGEKDRFFLVSESSLMKLFYSCPRCHSECDSNVQRVHGSSVSVVQRCRSCDHDLRWTSQPYIRDIPSGNLHMSAAILFSGAGISKSFRFLDHLGVPRISYSTFTTHQNRYLQPSIHSVWKDEQQKVMELIKTSGGSFNAAGDGRSDSPGHSAKFGTYTLLDTDLNKVVHLEVVTVTEVANSNCMEKEGLVRALAHLEANNLQLNEITTDRHVSIRKYLREKKVHQTLDVWHTSKGLCKKVDKLGKTKAFSVATKWKKSISNHMYWCASSTPDGHPDVMEAKWLSVVNHMQNIHIHDNPHFPNCLHGPLAGKERKKKWLVPKNRPEMVALMKQRLEELNSKETPRNEPQAAANRSTSRSKAKENPGDNVTSVLEDIDICLAAHVGDQQAANAVNAKGHPLVAHKVPKSQYSCQYCRDKTEDIRHLKEELDSLKEEYDAYKEQREEERRKMQEENRLLRKTIEKRELERDLAKEMVARLKSEGSAISKEDIFNTGKVRPHPGILPASVAKEFSMVELSGGSNVFLHQDQYHQAVNKCIAPSRRGKKDGGKPDNQTCQKKDGQPAARYLLTVFFSFEEMAKGSLSKSSNHEMLDKTIIDAVKAFCILNSDSTGADIHRAISCKLSAQRDRQKKMWRCPRRDERTCI